MKSTKKGFTLIELLVVIAIIGILSAIVLASLSNARQKAQDAKVKSQLDNMRAAAELYANNNSANSYQVTANTDSVCHPPAGDTTGLLNLTNVNSYPAGTTLKCNDSTTAWAQSANLSTTGQFWCVDSSGSSTPATAQLADGTTHC